MCVVCSTLPFSSPKKDTRWVVFLMIKIPLVLFLHYTHTFCAFDACGAGPRNDYMVFSLPKSISIKLSLLLLLVPLCALHTKGIKKGKLPTAFVYSFYPLLFHSSQQFFLLYEGLRPKNLTRKNIFIGKREREVRSFILIVGGNAFYHRHYYYILYSMRYR